MNKTGNPEMVFEENISIIQFEIRLAIISCNISYFIEWITIMLLILCSVSFEIELTCHNRFHQIFPIDGTTHDWVKGLFPASCK